ncbi:MAG: tyrosine--tRNA ligase [Patescibacteria group bacterium]|jgi:tyrosyl-tRNA synthetase
MKIDTDAKKIEKVLSRGIDEIINKEHLEKKLKSGRRLRIKFGIDPTSSDLHLGHSIPLRKLRQFQNLGHKIIFLIGDFTATIGDPSGRMDSRRPLAKKQVQKNMKDYVSQAGKILDIKKVEIRYNSEWYEKKGAEFLMQLTSRFTYARLIERDDFKRRIKEDIDVSMLELIYPLLQGYDSVELKADVEIGGRDQKFNFLMGRKVQKKYNQPQQDIITVPLIEGTDGLKKMSKSIGNYIGLNDPSFKMYGKIMSIPDELIWKYFNLLTDVSLTEIEEMKEKKQGRLLSLLDIKKKLAKEIVSLYCSEKETQYAADEFEKVFKRKEIPTDIPKMKIPEGKMPILDLLVNAKTVLSKSEAKRLILQKGVKIDNKVEDDWRKIIDVKKGMTIQAGRRKFVKIA